MLVVENAEEFRAQLNGTATRTMTFLSERLNKEAVKLQSFIVSEKLQGQVLHHRSGKLAGSIRPGTLATPENLAVEVLGGGGPAWYGRVHNYGGTFAFIRRGKPGKMTFPKRNFMESSLAERADLIREGLLA